MKKWIVILAAALLLGCFSGCMQDEALRLQVGDFRLTMTKRDAGWGVEIADGARVLYACSLPVTIKTVANDNAIPAKRSAAYDNVTLADGKIRCEASVTGKGGTVFKVIDVYSSADAGFLMDRTVTVEKTGENEEGFATLYTLEDVDGGTAEDYEFFIPAVLYKDAGELGTNALMAQMDLYSYVKETRCGTPLAMLRGKSDGYSLGILHVDPQISGEENIFQRPNSISNAAQYGAIGYAFDERSEYGVSVDFVYPSTEMPKSYETGATVTRYHETTTGNTQHYTLGIIPEYTELYNDAMVKTYLGALAMETVDIASVDLEQVYEANMELYNDLFLYYEDSESGKFAAGMPSSISVIGVNKNDDYSFAIGFVGAQTTVAAELIREGCLRNDQAALEKGKQVLDFWTAEHVYSDVLPPSIWYPQNGPNAGRPFSYPCFLRYFTDAAEGFLDGCIYGKQAGLDVTAWEEAVQRIGEFLINNQNEGGSYYRVYNTDGTVCTDVGDGKYQGTSKLNTPVPVRFLCRMYDYTGDQRYYDAAVKAADYCYEELYLKLGKYVGGTPDNPNVPDKEAAIFAMYAFSAVYDMTGDEKYVPALEHAVVSTMSWVYTYDFAVPYVLSEEYAHLNVFREPITAGWSVIATGHSAIDTYGAAAYHEIFKQYLRSGDEGYLKVAGLLQNNTKLGMDLEGKWGFNYKGFCLEACNVADQVFLTAGDGVWLPWISAAFMEPMIRMEEDFGGWDMYALLEQHSREELLEMLQ